MAAGDSIRRPRVEHVALKPEGPCLFHPSPPLPPPSVWRGVRPSPPPLAPPRALSGDEIISTVAAFFNIKLTDLKGTRRLKRFVRPRHIAMWMVREHTNHSFPEIGRLFGRDHATVQHACKKIRAEHESDADLRSTIGALSRNLSC